MKNSRSKAKPKRFPGVVSSASFGNLFLIVNILSQSPCDQLGLDLMQKPSSRLLLNLSAAQWWRMKPLDAGGPVLNLHEVATNGSAGADNDVMNAQHTITPNTYVTFKIDALLGIMWEI